MQIERVISCVDGHTCGEPLRLVIGGLPRLVGDTMLEKRNYFRDHLDFLRRFITYEPRGFEGIVAAAFTEPCNPEADLGIIFFDTTRYPSGCGHGSMAVAVMAVELGMIAREEPITHVKIETPSGLVSARVEVRNGRVESVTIRNVPAFVHSEGHVVEVPGYGSVRVDIAYGGLFYIVVSSRQLPWPRLHLERIDEILRVANLIKKAVSGAGIEVVHPRTKDHELDTVLFYEDSPELPNYSKVIVCGEGEGVFDRSPCGTGTSARLALLHRQNRLKVGETITHESIIGTTFEGTVTEQAVVGDYSAVIPEIKGTAHIVGFTQLVLDSRDPVGDGFLPIPTWEPGSFVRLASGASRVE